MGEVSTLFTDTKRAVGNMLHARMWQPGHFQFYTAQVADRGRNAARGYSDEDHLRAAATWLRAAQDSQPDGGFSGRYKLHAGWTSSYPETTGYLVPTCLDLAKRLDDPDWEARAARAIDFLLPLQLENGAFPGGEVAENTAEPSPFNTGQILNGLNIWARDKRDTRVEAAAARAAAWLISVQDDDGAFRQHFYANQPSAYSSHLSCWLAEYGVLFDDTAARKAAERHLDWVLPLQDERTGFFARSGFFDRDHEGGTAATHTIAYTIWGVLLMGLLLEREDAVDAAERAAAKIMGRLEILKFLPGRLNSEWRIDERAQCLTGNAQMALIWLRLFDERGDVRFVNAALRAIDLIKRAQPMDNPNAGIQGGVAGSDPVWGTYLFHALPNWAAKFYIDALLHKERVIARMKAA
ncbi:MAG: prenyltransferase/squalene oxidase repeat-containing protein [Pacificimonas sp.]